MKGFKHIVMPLLLCNMILIVLITFIHTGKAEIKGVEDVNNLVDSQTINNYFIDNPEYWKSCLKHRNSIYDKKDNYIPDEQKNRYIANLREGHSYEWAIFTVGSQYKMNVQLTCDFDVSFATNAFGRSNEKFSYDGGTILFDMKIKETVNGNYVLKGMKAKKDR